MTAALKRGRPTDRAASKGPDATRRRSPRSSSTELDRLECRKLELEIAALEREARAGAATADAAHVYTFSAGVEIQSVRSCVDTLGHWMRREPGCPITLILNSPGGSVTAGLHLYDFLEEIRAHGHHLTTVALGRAASMAAILLQAGDVRRIGKRAWLLIHEVSKGDEGKISELQDNMRFAVRLQDQITEILATRSKLSRTQIRRRWSRKEWWLDAADALKHGFVDEVSA